MRSALFTRIFQIGMSNSNKQLHFVTLGSPSTVPTSTDICFHHLLAKTQSKTRRKENKALYHVRRQQPQTTLEPCLSQIIHVSTVVFIFCYIRSNRTATFRGSAHMRVRFICHSLLFLVHLCFFVYGHNTLLLRICQRAAFPESSIPYTSYESLQSEQRARLIHGLRILTLKRSHS